MYETGPDSIFWPVISINQKFKMIADYVIIFINPVATPLSLAPAILDSYLKLFLFVIFFSIFIFRVTLVNFIVSFFQ